MEAESVLFFFSFSFFAFPFPFQLWSHSGLAFILGTGSFLPSGGSNGVSFFQPIDTMNCPFLTGRPCTCGKISFLAATKRIFVPSRVKFPLLLFGRWVGFPSKTKKSDSKSFPYLLSEPSGFPSEASQPLSAASQKDRRRFLPFPWSSSLYNLLFTDSSFPLFPSPIDTNSVAPVLISYKNLFSLPFYQSSLRFSPFFPILTDFRLKRHP